MMGRAEREAASVGPLILKQPGTPEHAWQVIHLLQSTFRNREAMEEHWQAALARAEEHRVYAVVPAEKPYGSMDALLRAEIGMGVRESIAIVQARAEQPKLLLDGPGPATAAEKAIGSNTTNIIGRGADYLTARIARDRPDILERMRAGEFKSVRQAAIEAGITKPKVILTLEPLAIARTLRLRLSVEQLAALVTALVTTEE